MTIHAPLSLSSHELLCHSKHSLLLIIDLQERLSAAMPEKVIHQVIHNTHILLQASQTLAIPAIHSEQYPQGLGNTVAELDSEGWLQQPFVKTCFSCSEEAGFLEKVAAFKKCQIVICGIEAHICVLQTALQLQQHGYQVFVVEDAVCSRKKQHFRNALSRLQQNGVIISNSESVMFEWLKHAGHAEFKTLSRLIK